MGTECLCDLVSRFLVWFTLLRSMPYVTGHWLLCSGLCPQSLLLYLLKVQSMQTESLSVHFYRGWLLSNKMHKALAVLHSTHCWLTLSSVLCLVINNLSSGPTLEQ
jgi:hypothetical protein